MALILYHHNSSVCAAKVRVAFAEKGLDWESRLMRLDGDQFDPAYVRLNPMSVVPTLVHDGKAIIESNVILEYLEDAFPEPSLRPASAHDRAEARLLMKRLDDDATGLHHAASILTYAIAYRHHLIEQAGGPGRSRLAAAIERSMNRKSRLWLEDAVFRGTDAPSFRDAVLRFDRALAGIEERLAFSDWLAGPGFSIADAAYLPYMIRLDLLHLKVLWRDRPLIADWFGRLKARQGLAAVMDWYEPRNLEVLTGRGLEAAEAVEAMLVHGAE